MPGPEPKAQKPKIHVANRADAAQVSWHKSTALKGKTSHKNTSIFSLGLNPAIAKLGPYAPNPLQVSWRMLTLSLVLEAEASLKSQ